MFRSFKAGGFGHAERMVVVVQPLVPHFLTQWTSVPLQAPKIRPLPQLVPKFLFIWSRLLRCFAVM